MSVDCSVGGNPLAQLNKRVQQDRTLQHGSHLNINQRNEGQSFKSGSYAVRDANKFQVEQFMGAKSGVASPFMGSGIIPGPLGLGNVSQSRISGSPGKEVAHGKTGSLGGVLGWSQEFNQQVGSPAQSSPALSSASVNSASSPAVRGGYRPSMMRPVVGMHSQVSRSMSTLDAQQQTPALNKEAWDRQFQELERQVEKNLNISATAENIQRLQEMQKEVVAEDGIMGEDYESRFQKIWDDLHEQTKDVNTQAEFDPSWDHEYQRTMSGRPVQAGEYTFESDNQYLHNPNAYEIGCILMENGAKLSEAALAFEAAVQEDPRHPDAWLRLGLVQTQNEKELNGINALEHCLKVDPTNLTALMTVEVSYINEGYDVSAFTMLAKWLETKYPSMEKLSSENADRYNLSRSVIEQYLKVANALPDVDPEVQLGLGILFYADGEFNKTIDCFRAALAVNPDDECMWNRLGASLANSNRSEEAIQAYHRAIQLKPTFVRARYNLAVSSMNIGCYKEAAEHLLTALSMHEVEGVVVSHGIGTVPSSNILETLKRAFIAMERRDLLEKVSPRMDLHQFRTEFKF